MVSTEPPDDLSGLTTPGVGRPGDGAVARAVDQVHPDAHSESMRGFADSSTDLSALGGGGGDGTSLSALDRGAEFCLRGWGGVQGGEPPRDPLA